MAALVSVCAAQYYTPTQAYDNTPDESAPEGMPEGASATDNASEPTDSRPQAGEQPQTPPETSTGETASELEQGQSLTKEQVTSFGQIEEPGEAGAVGAVGLVGGIIPSGIQYRVLYDGSWSYGPAALSFGQQTNMLVSVNQPQRIWSYEKYPNGNEVWEQWGDWYPGDYNAWFDADAVGWHLVAIYGETSGWSNAVWIYVEPGSPDVANGGPQPVLSETEEEETEAPDVGEIQP
ncbi:MAG TPA: hypothetical protein VLB04_08890 [Methanotrichaceae archaeon]|nr:hypothetical protein [Methanotrichaceae archaeon]